MTYRLDRTIQDHSWRQATDTKTAADLTPTQTTIKADRAGLLSVVCRRLCGDENASIATVHKALDLFDDQRNALTYIAVSVGADLDILGEIQANVAQAVKSLGEKTVEVAKLQEGLKNYEAHVEGLTTNIKQLSETIEDLKQNTDLTKIESALDDYNSPTHYGNHPEGNRLGTVERVRIGLLVLWSKWSESHREAQESEAMADRLTTERYLAQELLDKLNAPRLAGGHELDLSARIRSLFNTKV